MAQMFEQRYYTQRVSLDLGSELKALSAPLQLFSEEAKSGLDDDDRKENKGGFNELSISMRNHGNMDGYSIHELLNGDMLDDDTLVSFDECLIQILSEWDLYQITSKTIIDIEHLVNKKCNADHWHVMGSIIDPPHILYEILLRLARKIKAISLVIGNQKMIYVPETIEELENINSRIVGLNDFITLQTKRTFQTLHASHRSNRDTSRSSPPPEDDIAKYPSSQSSSTEPVPLPFVDDDENKKGNLQSLLFVDRMLYKDTALCAKREQKYIEKKKKNLLNMNMKNLVHVPKISKTKKELSQQLENTEDKMIKTSKDEQQLTEIVRHHEETKANPKKAHPHHIHCEGCDKTIKFSVDYDRIIVYKVPIKGDQLFYFHDTFCVSLRRLKESIRRYVMEEQLDARPVNSVVAYIRNLFINFNTVISTRVIVPRPTPLTAKLTPSKSKHEDDQQHSIIKFVRANAYKLIIRQQALEARRAKRFEEEYAWKFAHIPQNLQYTDMVVYGPSLAEYVIQQLLSKQMESLWLILAYIVSQMSTTTSLQIIEEHRTDLAKVKDIHYLDIMLTSMIEAADFTIAMALYLSAYMTENAENDLSRADDFERIAKRYVRIASKLVGSVESDHLLTLLLETPTDIAHLSVFEIAIKYGISEFMDDSRIQMLMAEMWCQFDLLDPQKNFRTRDIELSEIIILLAKQPSRFYYCPVGRYWTESVMYIVYIIVVTAVVYGKNYRLASDLSPEEWIMWVFNAGFVAGEVTQILYEGVAYLTDVGNYFDMLIILNWAILFVLRYGCKYLWIMKDSKQCYASTTINESIADALTRNSTMVLIYMAIFCIQICILWSRVCLIFSTSRTVGPFVSMIPQMIRDILQWTFVLGIFYIGFSFGIDFIVAGDISGLCDADGTLEEFSIVAEYNFILLLGQSEWGLLEANACINNERSLLVKLFMFGFSVLGTILLLNLLIAMMASTYEQIRGGTTKQVNFARAEQTFSLSHRDAIIPPPLNVVVFVFSIIWFLIEFLVWLLSFGHFILNMEKLLPLRVDYDANFEQFTNSNARDTDKTPLICCGILQRVKNPTQYIEKLMTDYKKTTRYCQYCRCYMRINGNISHYFQLFVNYRLDEADVKFMKSLMQNAGICPQCYRPYRIYEITESGIKSNRLYRWQVILELLSFYVFMVVVYLPLIILISLPALFSAILAEFDNIKSANKLVEGERQIVKDDKYVQLVENIIEKESTTNTELLSAQVSQLNRKLIQIKMDQRSSTKALSKQSAHLQDYSRILQGMVPYIKKINSKMNKSISNLHENENKYQQQLEQHKEEIAVFKHQLSELTAIGKDEDEESIKIQRAIGRKHDEEMAQLNQYLKEQRIETEIETEKVQLQKQSMREIEELHEKNDAQLNNLQKQIERQQFLRIIEEKSHKKEQQKRELLALKLEQHRAILNAQIEQMRLLKEAQNKRKNIELQLNEQQTNEICDVEKEIFNMKQNETKEQQEDYQTARMEELQSELLKLQSDQKQQETQEKQQKEVVEIRAIKHKSTVHELNEQMDAIRDEEQLIWNESIEAKRKMEKERILHEIEIEKMKLAMIRLKLLKKEEEDEEEDSDRVP